MHEINQLLQDRFPNAKVEVFVDGIWHVILDVGYDYGPIIESYRAEKGNLIRFITTVKE
jgi:hypothetical protein